MTREFVVGTVVLALVAAVVTGVVSDKIVEDLENHFGAGALWSLIAFMLLVPAAFGAATLTLPGRRADWLPFVLVASAASLAMAYAVGREFMNSQDQNDAVKIASRAWYGVMYFGAGMLGLSVALLNVAKRVPAGDKLSR